jgi:phosphatidate cytidylyltransferase
LLKSRLVSSLVMIPALLGLLLLDFRYPLGAPGVWLLPLALAVSATMVHELLGLWQARSDRPLAWPVYLGALVTVLAAASAGVGNADLRVGGLQDAVGRLGAPLLAMMAGLVLVFGAEMARYRRPGLATGRVALSLLAIGYAGGLLSLLVALRWTGGPQWGMVALISLVVIVKFSDMGAYFTGRAVGRHKMAPVLSPGKTWEGTIGGLLAAGFGAWICQAWIAPALIPTGDSAGSLERWLLYGWLVALGGMAGDLAESLLKRDVARKDSGGWLPGLGGALDVLDSLLFAAVPAYLCWACGLIGPA